MPNPRTATPSIATPTAELRLVDAWSRRSTFATHALASALAILCASGPAVAQEPGLEGRDDIVHFDGFEDSEWYRGWGLSEAPRSTSIHQDGAFRGSSHLRVSLPEGSHYGTSFTYDFADMGVSPPREIYFRYTIRFGPTWGGGGGKLPGFGATYDTGGWGGTPSNGTNGWSARMLFSTPDDGDTSATRIGYYTYHAAMTDRYGEHWQWSGGPIGPEGTLEHGRWYQVECYVRNNTPGENDGILRGWVDGAMVFERLGIRFRDVERLDLENVWFNIYQGGSRTAPRDMYVDFDNVVIAREYVGTTTDLPASGPDAGSPAPDAGVDAGSGSPDAGLSISDAGEIGPRADSGSRPADAGSGDSEACGCGVSTRSRATPPALLMTLAALWIGLRRRSLANRQRS